MLVCVFAYRMFEDARRLQIASLNRDADFVLSRLVVVPAAGLRMALTLASIREFSPKTADCQQRVHEILDRYEAFSSAGTLSGGEVRCAYTKTGGVSVAEAVGAMAQSPDFDGEA